MWVTARPRSPASPLITATVVVVVRPVAPDVVRQTQAALVVAGHTCARIVAVSVIEACMGAAKPGPPAFE